MPEQGRGIAIDRRMRFELADSLQSIRNQLTNQASDNCIQQHLASLQSVITMLHSSERISPAVFGFYYDLVFTIFNGADNNIVNRKLKQLLASAKQAEQSLTIKNLSNQDLGSEELVLLYRQCFDTDPEERYGFLGPSTDNSQRMKTSINTAMKLMRDAVPALYAEINEIISEILLAAAPRTEDVARFDGASSYQLWGAVVLNADNQKSDIQMLETLAHECSHCLLFGLTIHEPLVRNDDEERYQSPLRDDPRPMDGIFHATFVASRMHYALQEAMKSSLLTVDQKQECKLRLAGSRKAFYEGHAVLSELAEYSDTGREIMQNAFDYMQQTA